METEIQQRNEGSGPLSDSGVLVQRSEASGRNRGAPHLTIRLDNFSKFGRRARVCELLHAAGQSETRKQMVLRDAGWARLLVEWQTPPSSPTLSSAALKAGAL
jgi:hypothetical protein